MAIHRLRIFTERRKFREIANKLSSKASDLVSQMAISFDETKNNKFDIDDFRGSGYGSWREIIDLMYELESRRFGKVVKKDDSASFHAFIPLLQNILDNGGVI